MRQQYNRCIILLQIIIPALPSLLVLAHLYLESRTNTVNEPYL